MKNFEGITEPLTVHERKLIGAMIDIMKRTDANHRIKTPQLVEELRTICRIKGYDAKVSGVTVRKLVNLIRRNSIIPIIGTDRGYYYTTDKDEITDAITSLQERCDAIMSAAEGMKKFL